jgi:hypothetical protein
MDSILPFYGVLFVHFEGEIFSAGKFLCNGNAVSPIVFAPIHVVT